MHYILHVHVGHFYVNALCRDDPQLTGRTIVVHRAKAVLDASEEALRLGVLPGMSLNEAKTLLKAAEGRFAPSARPPQAPHSKSVFSNVKSPIPSSKTSYPTPQSPDPRPQTPSPIPQSPQQTPIILAWQEDLFSSAQERWLDLCAELTDIVEPEHQHTAYLDLSAHGDPYDLAESLQGRIADKLGLEVRLGLARCRWTARLASDHLGGLACGPEWRLASREAVEEPTRFLSTFSIDCLLPVLPEHRRRLAFLGCRSIGDVAQIPDAALSSQFDVHAPLIRSAAQGAADAPIKALYPPDKVLTHLSFEGCAENLEAIETGMRLVSKRLGIQLVQRDAYGMLLELEIEYESGRREHRKRRFSKPIANVPAALCALRLLLGERFPEPIAALRVSLPGLRKLDRSQPELSGSASAQSRPTNLEHAFCAIRGVFGDQAVQTAGEVVPPRRTRVLRAWKEATGWV